MTSTSWMHEAGHSKLVHWDNPQDGMGKEMGGGSGQGDTCTLMADSRQCMTKTTTIL